MLWNFSISPHDELIQHVHMMLLRMFGHLIFGEGDLAESAFDLIEIRTFQTIVVLLILQSVLMLAKSADSFHFVDVFTVGVYHAGEWLRPAEGALLI